jgi:hypothetical protein
VVVIKSILAPWTWKKSRSYQKIGRLQPFDAQWRPCQGDIEEKSQYCGKMGRISSDFQARNLRRRPLNEDLGLIVDTMYSVIAMALYKRNANAETWEYND